MLNISWIVFYVRNIMWFIAVSIAHREPNPQTLKIFSSASYLEEKTRVANNLPFVRNRQFPSGSCFARRLLVWPKYEFLMRTTVPIKSVSQSNCCFNSSPFRLLTLIFIHIFTKRDKIDDIYNYTDIKIKESLGTLTRWRFLYETLVTPQFPS